MRLSETSKTRDGKGARERDEARKNYATHSYAHTRTRCTRPSLQFLESTAVDGAEVLREVGWGGRPVDGIGVDRGPVALFGALLLARHIGPLSLHTTRMRARTQCRRDKKPERGRVTSKLGLAVWKQPHTHTKPEYR